MGVWAEVNMADLTERVLPNTEPPYVRIDLARGEDGYYDVTAWALSGAGFVHRDRGDLYERLTAEEAADVVLAVLEAQTG